MLSLMKSAALVLLSRIPCNPARRKRTRPSAARVAGKALTRGTKLCAFPLVFDPERLERLLKGAHCAALDGKQRMRLQLIVPAGHRHAILGNSLAALARTHMRF